MKFNFFPVRHQRRGAKSAPAQRGFALVSAIFLLVVLAGLGVAMVTFSTSQQVSSGYDVLGARAYQAAKTGIEWALYQRLNPMAHGATSAYCPNTTNMPDNLTLPSGTTLSAFTVTVKCISVSATNMAVPVTIRTITSTACNQPSGGACPGTVPGPDYIQRVLTVTVQK